MKSKNSRGKDVSTLIDAFIEESMRHGLASEVGDYRTANTSFDKMTAIYRKVKRMGLTALEQLLPLLSSNEPHVKVSAASLLLEYFPEESERALKEVEANPLSLAAFNAKYVLKEWHKKSLNFP